MAIIKLQNEGEEHTMTVTQCEVAKGNYGEQVKFSDGTDLLYLPKDTAERQLSRLGINYEECVGMTLTFSRDPNPKKGAKPYWGVRYAGAEPAAPKPSPRVEPAKPASGTAVQPRREAILAQYLVLWDAVAGHLAQTSKKYGYGLDAAAIQAATATVWISWKDKGIQPDGLAEAKPAEKAPEVKMPAPSGKRVPPPDFSKIPPPDDNDMDDSLPF